MILYKYVSWADGEKILADKTLGFSQTMHFNDPFEGPRYPPMSAEPADNEVDQMMSVIRLGAKERLWQQSTGVLSLTRTPINALMWAHYADQHQGMVIGIDMVEAGLTDEQTNLVPAQYGSVIYVTERPTQDFVAPFKTGLAVGATHYFPHDHFEKLQRLFLQKPICWAYEEEVRVVKCLRPKDGEKNLPDGLSPIQVRGRDLFLYPIPPNAIREVYFGFRTPIEADESMHQRLKEAMPHVQPFECRLNSNKFTVEAAAFVSVHDTEPEPPNPSSDH